MTSPSLEHNYLSNLDVVERFPFSIYHRPIRNHVLRLIREQESYGRPLSILNVGCGLSQVLTYIDPKHYYLGVDVDERVVAMCRQRFSSRQTEFAVSQPYELPAQDGAFDVVFATEVVEHVLEPERWLAELAKKVAPGGTLQLSTPNYGGWLLPLIERTFLEWMARRQGFTRKGLHPTPFDAHRLGTLLQGAGLARVEVRKTPLHLALIGSGRA